MKILVSACLLGARCRYDGASKEHPEVLKLAERHTLVPVCPEQLGGLPTPRTPSERQGDAVCTREGTDVTEAYRRGAEEALRAQTGDESLRAVHRLDKDTSGCLLFAKGDEAFDAAVSVFKTRRVKKLYSFLAVGRIEVAASTITEPIDGEPAKTTIRRVAFNENATFGTARIESLLS